MLTNNKILDKITSFVLCQKTKKLSILGTNLESLEITVIIYSYQK